MRALALLTLLAGCNLVFDIEETESREEEAPSDGDGDGEPDATDNCIEVANTNQRDIDDDGLGDACDNCPHITNRDQSAVGDPDPVGDVCDPHPAQMGDCLVLLDMFTDPAAFAAHWEVVSLGAPPAIDAVAGAVTLTPADSYDVSMLARDDAGALLTGVFDTHVRARSTVATGDLYAVSNYIPSAGLSAGYGCGLLYYDSAKTAWSNARSASTSSGMGLPAPFSSSFVDDVAVMRLLTPTVDEPTMVRCRVDYGLALGIAQVYATQQSQPSKTMGGAGVVVTLDPVIVEAVALYSVIDGACPAAIYR